MSRYEPLFVEEEAAGTAGNHLMATLKNHFFRFEAAVIFILLIFRFTYISSFHKAPLSAAQIIIGAIWTNVSDSHRGSPWGRS